MKISPGQATRDTSVSSAIDDLSIVRQQKRSCGKKYDTRCQCAKPIVVA